MKSDFERDGRHEAGSTPLECRTEVISGCSVIHVSGEVDLATASILERTLDAVIALPHPIIVDFDATKYIDSTGLQVLLRARQRHQAPFAAAALAPTMRRVFELTKIADAIPLFDTLKEALSSMCLPAAAGDVAGF